MRVLEEGLMKIGKKLTFEEVYEPGNFQKKKFPIFNFKQFENPKKKIVMRKLKMLNLGFW